MKTFVLLLCVLISISTVFGQSPIKKIYYGASKNGSIVYTSDSIVHYIDEDSTYFRINANSKQIIAQKKIPYSRNQLCFSKNGKFVLIIEKLKVQYRFKAKIWNLYTDQTTQLEDTLWSDYNNRTRLQFSDDGLMLILYTISHDATGEHQQFIFYDLESLTIQKKLIDTQASVTPRTILDKFTVSQNYHYLLQYRVCEGSGCKHSILMVYDLEKNSLLYSINEDFNYHLYVVSSIEVRNDGISVVMYLDFYNYNKTYKKSNDNNFWIIQYNDGGVIDSVEYKLPSIDAYILEDRKTMVLRNYLGMFPKQNYSPNTVYTYNLTSKNVDSLNLNSNFTQICFHPNSQNFVALTDEGLLTSSLTKNAKKTIIFPETFWKDPNYAMYYYLKFAGQDTSFRLYATSNYRYMKTISIFQDTIKRFHNEILFISSDGRYYETSGSLGFILDSNLTIDSNRHYSSNSSHSTNWRYIGVSKNSDKCYVSDYDRLLRIDRTNLHIDSIIVPRVYEPIYATFNETTNQICYWVFKKNSYSKTFESYVCITSLNTGFLYKTNINNLTHVSQSNLGKYVAMIQSNSTLTFWNLNSFNLQYNLPIDNVVDMAFTTDDKYLITVHNNSTIKIWDVEKGKILRYLTDYKMGLTGIAINPDGKTFATGTSNGSIVIWDLTSINSSNNGILLSTDDKTKSDTNTLSITAYPNPCSTDILQFSLPGNTQLYNIQVVNSLGDIVMQEIQPQQPTINIQQLPSGNYYAILQSSTSVVRVPFVVVH